jgi:hypothetical protein
MGPPLSPINLEGAYMANTLKEVKKLISFRSTLESQEGACMLRSGCEQQPLYNDNHETSDNDAQTDTNYSTKKQESAHMAGLAALANQDHCEAGNLDQVGSLFRQGACYGLAIYSILMLAVFKFAPVESYQEPTGFEASAHIASFLLLFVSKCLNCLSAD